MTQVHPESFPDGFLWGCSTAAYQIEGSPLADGAGASIWHRFSHMPGNILNGDNGDTACGHYHRSFEDVALLRELGMQAYRFSIAWGRIFPEGTGRVNPAGIDFYERLVDALLGAGIAPMVTLYHWDLPAALDDRGGWLSPDIAKWFGDYAEYVYRRLDDRVPFWITINEPWVVADQGYRVGTHAPGHTSLAEAVVASRNLLRTNAEAVRRYRAVGRHEIGLAVNLEPKLPASTDPEDRAASELADAYMNRQYLDQALLGRLPMELARALGEPVRSEPDVLDEPLDFIGVNYYTRAVTRAAPAEQLLDTVVVRQPRSTYTEMGWEVYPRALTQLLVDLKERYGNIPIYVTENGAAFQDPPVAIDGRIRDSQREEYLRTHIEAIRRAIDAGCDIRGYFVWSFLDNFEWAFGYDRKFGLVHVDFETLTRTPKDSAYFYRQVIESNGRRILADNKQETSGDEKKTITQTS